MSDNLGAYNETKYLSESDSAREMFYRCRLSGKNINVKIINNTVKKYLSFGQNFLF